MGVSDDKIIIKPVDVDFEFIKKYEPHLDLHNLYPRRKIYLVLGRLDPVKNILWMVELFEHVSQKNMDVLLLVVGEGSEKRKIENLIKRYNLENNIKIENWTNDPISYLRTADCLLFPSLRESYGLVVMEAQAVGTPIIMSDVGVANYELKASEKVKILPVNDKEKWMKAILSI